MIKFRFLFLLVAISLVILTTANAANLFSDPPAVGADAPTFKLISNEGKEIKLKSFRGKWVVLYFYPKNFTFNFHKFTPFTPKFTPKFS